MLKKTLILLILVLLSSSCFALEITNLSNGAKIFTQKSDSNIITLDIWMRVGSRNESPYINGISHFIEHLIFKGTNNLSAGEMDRLVEESGGVLNAETSKDYTHFYIMVPKKSFYLAADLLSEVLINASFPNKELEKERKVVLEEIYRSHSNHSSNLYNMVCTKAFRYSPYMMSVLGNLSSVSNISRQTIIDYYKKYYVGSNMSIVATGGLPDDAKKYLIKQFKYARRGQRTGKNKEEYLSEKKLLEVKKDVQKAYFEIAYSSPQSSSFDSYVMDVIITLLGNGRNSRLNKKIKEDKNLVDSIGISYPTPIDPNLTFISVTCDPEEIEKATEAVFAEMKLLQNEAVSEKEIDRAKTLITVDYKITATKPEALASEIGYFSTVADVSYQQNYLENINKVTADDIKRVASKYFDFYTMGRFIPE